MLTTDPAGRSAAAMRLEDGSRPWYLGATPIATLPWLIRLRWATACIELCVLLAVLLLPGIDLPLDHLAWLVGAAALTNAAVAVRLSKGASLPRPAATAALALDVVLLTGLLELTGGPFNPFSVVYVVQVALAALTLGPAWASLVGACAAAGYGVLIYWHTTEIDPGHHRLNDFPTHLFTMWIAIAVTAELAAYFVVQASNALARREQELEAMRVRAARSERLVSLTTLAAGAAHELSTPLATIALTAKELEHAAVAHGNVPHLVDDARLVRSQVDRCQAILDQMSGRAGGSAADLAEPLDIAAMIADIKEHLSVEQARRLHLRLDPASVTPCLPRSGFTQVLLSLVTNAFDATLDETTPVIVEVTQGEERLRVAVTDEGCGMPAAVLERAGEPFFTTKEPGRGLGLGLFLARVFAERFGGTLSLSSDRGTTAVIELPLRSASPEPV